ncbi:MAG: glycosyltransferase [Eubacterium sp.]|nr:glycosyltransferase [Eubacterium sp.]
MRILVYQWKAYNYADICEAFTNLGYEYVTLEQDLSNYDEDPEFEEKLAQVIRKESCGMVFTVNYFALITGVCAREGIPYVVWTCDNPLISMYHQKVFHPCNYFFTFDKTNYLEFQGMGVEHIWYLPLAVNTERIGYLLNNCSDLFAYENDIAFVGSLYERNSYDRMRPELPEYLRGYFDAAIWAQQCVNGGNILEEMLTVPVLEQLERYFKLEKSKDSFSDLGLIFATTVLGFKTAEQQRRRALTELSKRYRVSIYSNSDTRDLLRVRYGGSLDYWSEMPKVFAASKINLNFTIPNIKSGLPLRIWDVLGSGGFLMTNFQAEIPYYFKHREDLVCFESIDELTELCGYYLKHEDARRQIAENGYRKVRAHHTYERRIAQMMEILQKGEENGI